MSNNWDLKPAMARWVMGESLVRDMVVEREPKTQSRLVPLRSLKYGQLNAYMRIYANGYVFILHIICVRVMSPEIRIKTSTGRC